MSVFTAEQKINEITEKEGFYEKVRQIVGYYDGVFWEDWDIKHLQRVADARYRELGGEL